MSEQIEKIVVAISEAIVEEVATQKAHPEKYLPTVRKLLGALERLTKISALRPEDEEVALVDNMVANGAGPVRMCGPGRNLGDDPAIARLGAIIEAIEPYIQQLLDRTTLQPRVQGLRAVLDSPYTSDEAKQQAARDLEQVLENARNGAIPVEVTPITSLPQGEDDADLHPDRIRGREHSSGEARSEEGHGGDDDEAHEVGEGSRRDAAQAIRG